MNTYNPDCLKSPRINQKRMMQNTHPFPDCRGNLGELMDLNILLDFILCKGVGWASLEIVW